jgi:histidine ammonia-lyase
MAIVLDGEHLTIEELVDIARHNEKIEIAPKSVDKIKECRTMLEEKIKAREIMYGINTGIG